MKNDRASFLENLDFSKQSPFNGIQCQKLYNPKSILDKDAVRLDLNESLYPSSSRCLNSVREITSEQVRCYGIELYQNYIESVAAELGTMPERLFFNNGSSEVLKQIFTSIANKALHVVLCRPCWPYYQSLCTLLGLPIISVPMIEKGDSFFFPTNIVESIASKSPGLLVINSPHMPSGTSLSFEEIDKVAQELPQTLIILDEAYWGFSKQYRKGFFNVDMLLTRRPNIVVVRTFSKFFGLAGLRVGFGWAHETTAKVLSSYGPLFGLSTPALAGTLAAIKEYPYYEDQSIILEKERDYLIDFINTRENFVAYYSSANFILVKCLNNTTQVLIDTFYDHGFVIRSCEGYGMRDYVRLSMGDSEITESIIDIFSNIL